MALTIKSLSKSYGDKVILDCFEYEFGNSGLYVITGKSGVGKTTLLRLIAGLDTDFSGEIIDGGVQNTSVAFQEYRLFPSLSALENVTLPNKAEGKEHITEKAKELLFKLGFSEADMYLRPSELSGGMKQRVSLARAFLRDAPILLLDEPTKELDEALRAAVYELIRNEAASRLVIMVTHNRDEIPIESTIDICI